VGVGVVLMVLMVFYKVCLWVGVVPCFSSCSHDVHYIF
jgi:hypothetical protein